jgi:Ca2+-transporting ATPase
LEQKRPAIWHSLSPAEALSLLGTDVTYGLSDEQVASRLAEYGPNQVGSERGVSALSVFARQFRNALVAVLLVATVVSFAIGETVDALVILAIVMLSAATGFAQEYRAENVVASLGSQLPRRTTVVRRGARVDVDAAQLVPGDIVVLSAGDRVPADCRIVECSSLSVDESSLTGESSPVPKSEAAVKEETPLADRSCMLFAGTTVASGRCVAVVTATGQATEFGGIVDTASSVEREPTPLERHVERMGRRFGLAALAIVLSISAFGLLREAVAGVLSVPSVLLLLLFGVSLAVAAIPEALPAVLTATLAAGARVMARNRALVRRMSAVEALGSTDVVCFDKTGTLTAGEMTVSNVFACGRVLNVTGSGYSPSGEVTEQDGGPPRQDAAEALTRIARVSLLCNDASLTQEGGVWRVQGDTTEGALLSFARKVARTSTDSEFWRRIAEVPFTHERKTMTTVNRGKDGSILACMKGAPEAVLRECDSVLFEGEVPLTAERAAEVEAAVNSLSAQGLRVVAVADRRGEPREGGGFVLLGLLAMSDPLRDDAEAAVREAREAGLIPVMITGDHRMTAVAVARKAGILREGDQVLTGQELQALGNGLDGVVERVAVYARISPMDKLRIVDAWKRRNKFVAMTGDGVNDVPALRRADVGIAMGMRGTDAAKDAADIVLADDSFATIVRAIQLGRWIRENISKYLLYLVQSNVAEVAVMSAAVLALFPYLGVEAGVVPLLPVHVLYINLATDGLPALALGLSPAGARVRKKSAHRGLFTRQTRLLLFGMTALQIPILLAAFVGGLPMGLEAARTRLFLLFVFMELALALNLSSTEESVLRARPHGLVVLAVLWEALLASLMVETQYGRSLLHLSVPTTVDLLWVISSVALTFAGVELLKLLARKRAFTRRAAPSPPSRLS